MKGFARVVNVDDSRSEVSIYGMIGQWDISASDFVQELNALGSRSIDVHINSAGGEVFEALAIYNALKNHRAAVNVYIDGYAASAASFVAMAGDEVVIAPNGELMMHDAMGSCAGNAEEFRKMLDLLERTSENISTIYAEKAGQDPKFWRKAMRRESWYNAKEAVSAGLADRIGRSSDTLPENVVQHDFAIYNYAGRTAAPDPLQVPIHKFNIGDLIREALNDAAKEYVA